MHKGSFCFRRTGWIDVGNAPCRTRIIVCRARFEDLLSCYHLGKSFDRTTSTKMPAPIWSAEEIVSSRMAGLVPFCCCTMGRFINALVMDVRTAATPA
jgi:hypothetical protein